MFASLMNNNAGKSVVSEQRTDTGHSINQHFGKKENILTKTLQRRNINPEKLKLFQPGKGLELPGNWEGFIRELNIYI